MSVRLRCVCGKENVLEAAAGDAPSCLRCGRPLRVPAAPVIADPYGLIEVKPPEPPPLKHPAAALEAGHAPHSVCEYLYWLLPLALVPLAFALGRSGDDTLRRFRKTLD